MFPDYHIFQSCKLMRQHEILVQKCVTQQRIRVKIVRNFKNVIKRRNILCDINFNLGLYKIFKEIVWNEQIDTVCIAVNNLSLFKCNF